MLRYRSDEKLSLGFAFFMSWMVLVGDSPELAVTPL
jgi:hypothetical protein